MELLRGARRAVLVFGILAGLASGYAIADEHSPPPKPSSSRPWVVLTLAPGQIGLLQRVDPVCAAKLVGSPSERGNIAGVDLSSDAQPQCLLLAREAVQLRQGETLRRDDRVAHTVVMVRAIPLKQNGVNLLRVDQNFGGSLSLVRYAVVSVVYDYRPRILLLVRELLPASMESDAAAVEYSNARRY